MAKKKRKKNPSGLPWWAWALGFVGLGGAALLLMGGESSASSGGLGVSAEDARLFDAFWQVAGREESRNQLADWRGVDLGGGASAGWLHFNQGYSLPSIFRRAYESNEAGFRAAMGEHADTLINSNFGRGINLNEPGLQDAIRSFLASPSGELAQKQTAYEEYFSPAIQTLSSVQPNADDTYKIMVAATRVWTGEINDAMANASTADAFADYMIQNPPRKDASGFVARDRLPRQLQNARAMLSSGQLAIT